MSIHRGVAKLLRTGVPKKGLSTFLDRLLDVEPVKNQHSKLLKKQDVIYSIETQDVKPGYMSEYLSNASHMLPELHDSDKIPAQLYGQFVVELGQLDRVYTILKFGDGYKDMDLTAQGLEALPMFEEYERTQGKLLRKREKQICYEFSFWPQYNDDYDGGIFELRTYSLKPGCLYEWGNHWANAIKLREKDAVMGLCSQIGDMYTVHHMWRYLNLEKRKTERDLAWKTGDWGDCVIKTVPLIRSLNVNILKATDYSPLR